MFGILVLVVFARQSFLRKLGDFLFSFYKLRKRLFKILWSSVKILGANKLSSYVFKRDQSTVERPALNAQRRRL